jgi:hypothetical protein
MIVRRARTRGHSRLQPAEDPAIGALLSFWVGSSTH